MVSNAALIARIASANFGSEQSALAWAKDAEAFFSDSHPVTVDRFALVWASGVIAWGIRYMEMQPHEPGRIAHDELEIAREVHRRLELTLYPPGC